MLTRIAHALKDQRMALGGVGDRADGSTSRLRVSPREYRVPGTTYASENLIYLVFAQGLETVDQPLHLPALFLRSVPDLVP